VLLCRLLGAPGRSGRDRQTGDHGEDEEHCADHHRGGAPPRVVGPGAGMAYGYATRDERRQRMGGHDEVDDAYSQGQQSQDGQYRDKKGFHGRNASCFPIRTKVEGPP